MTYAGRDLEHDRPVIFKFLFLGQISDWKALELFEREAKILRHLEHPRVPRLCDELKLEVEAEPALCLVFSRLPGRSLAVRLKEGWRLNEARARQIAQDLLEILIYLHAFSPPLIHRDIKPANILIDEQGRAALVDFGAVKDVLTRGQTVVGTFGYMAPEQFSGQVSSASDVYALGVSLIEALSGCAPEDIPRQDLDWDYHSLVNISPELKHWLDTLLRPQASQRPTAEQALSALLKPETQTEIDKTLVNSHHGEAPESGKKGQPVVESAETSEQLAQVLEPVTLPQQSKIQFRAGATPQIYVPYHGQWGTLLGDWAANWFFLGLLMIATYYLMPMLLPLWVMWSFQGLLFAGGIFMCHEVTRSVFLSAELTLERDSLSWEQRWWGKWGSRKRSLRYAEIRALNVKHADGICFVSKGEDEDEEIIYFRKDRTEAQWLHYQILAQLRPQLAPSDFQALLGASKAAEQDEEDEL